MHRYRFTIYAHDRTVDADDGAGADELLPAIEATAIARGTLTGTFDR